MYSSFLKPNTTQSETILDQAAEDQQLKEAEGSQYIHFEEIHDVIAHAYPHCW